MGRGFILWLVSGFALFLELGKCLFTAQLAGVCHQIKVCQGLPKNKANVDNIWLAFFHFNFFFFFVCLRGRAKGAWHVIHSSSLTFRA